MQLNTTEQIITALKAGEMVILMDDEDRENEGDLVKLAEFITEADINFMAQYARGLICLTLTAERCKQLNLPLMTTNNQSSLRTNFTLSIEAIHGVTTGISAADRAHTIRTAVAKNATAHDLCSPGHIFPLQASLGGVLNRAGHTEAGCDLAGLAGCTEAAVIVEILQPDGSMARRPQLEKFADQHQLKIGTINDLIAYRFRQEKTVQRLAQYPLDIGGKQFEAMVYKDTYSDKNHIALVYGTVDKRLTTVRVHSALQLPDLLPQAISNSWSIGSAIEYICQQKSGVLVLLHQDGLDWQCLLNTFSNPPKPRFTTEHLAYRENGIGSQILQDIGVQTMQVLGGQFRYTALSGFGLQITNCIAFSDYVKRS